MVLWLGIGIVLGIGLAYMFNYIARDKSGVGRMILTRTEDGKKIFSLEIDKDPDLLENMRYITFKVIPESEDENRE